MTRAKDISKIVTDADLSGTLDVTGTVTAGSVTMTRETGGYLFNTGGSTRAGIRSDDQNNLTLRTGTDAIKMHVGADGNVGIGTSSPEGLIHSFKGESGGLTANSNGNGLVIENSGHAGISIITPATSNANIYFGDGGSVNSGYIRYDHSADALKLKAQTDILFLGVGSAEKVRIEADTGNLLVGKTSTGIASAGHSLKSDGTFEVRRDIATANTSSVQYISRGSTVGIMSAYYSNSAIVGTIGMSSSGSDFFKVVGALNYFDTGVGNTGLRYYEGLRAIYPLNTDTDSGADNAIDLGLGAVRFDDVFATNGTIQTSDRNEKQDIKELSDAEQRVAVVAKGLMRKFRWINSVTEKGDNARTHFGIIAQDLQDAFTAEGLNAGDYAMFTSNTWWELDGEIYITEEEAPEGATEKTRLGVRYNQLLAFIISAI